jgi:predicted dehydrogenase
VTDWRAVLEDPAVDLVSITVPNAMHREVAVAAAEAGKHIWVEKPAGRGAADTEAVYDAVRRAGVINGVGFCYRFAPAVAHAQALIARARSARSRTIAGPSWATTRTGRTRRRRGASSAPTRALGDTAI